MYQKPIQIRIKGAQAGHQAAEWCSDNLVFEHWEMWLQNAWGDYLFEFQNEKDATLFALRWAEYG
jgi:hypothetical protein